MPDGKCAIATYAADATPEGDAKEVRGQRLGRNRERRRQAHKVLEMRVVERVFQGGDRPLEAERQQVLARLSPGRRA
jgi:hypothetical protein